MNILVGYDGSNAALQALLLAGKHAAMRGAKVEVVNCLTQDQEHKYEDIQKIGDDLEREVHYHLNSINIPYETHVVISDLEPGEELVHFAESNKIEEIIIGIRKRSKVGKLLFGSTAQYVILNSPCPVVSVK
jgi:nucleotide-binding universal stress UspA family protein